MSYLIIRESDPDFPNDSGYVVRNGEPELGDIIVTRVQRPTKGLLNKAINFFFGTHTTVRRRVIGYKDEQ